MEGLHSPGGSLGRIGDRRAPKTVNGGGGAIFFPFTHIRSLIIRPWWIKLVRIAKPQF